MSHCDGMSLNDEQHPPASRGSPLCDLYGGPVPSRSRGREPTDLWFTLGRPRLSAAGLITAQLSQVAVKFVHAAMRAWLRS